jgi:Kelch motif/Galactose oxidase, central domain
MYSLLLVRRCLASVAGSLLFVAGCGGGYGGGGAYTYSIGGTITGLTSSGLVLANGSGGAVDTVGPAAGATSFTFPNALASGSNYAVTIQTQPTSELCQVTNGTGQVGGAAVMSVVVACTGRTPWTWVSGANTVGARGVYGTQGVAGVGNVPGARDGSVSWTDGTGDLWLFGGTGYDSVGAVDYLNDLWRYSPASGQWTWVSGANTVAASGVYGTQGVAAAGNVPGARDSAISWIDGAGDLWVFGGYGHDSAGSVDYLNDLWRYSLASGQWTWVSGANTVAASGVYGTQGVAAAGNVPGARGVPVSWIDSAGDLWLFGGTGYDSVGKYGDNNDLWRFSPGSGQWTWVDGSQFYNHIGTYGTQGTGTVGNVPGARSGSVAWIDGAGDLWLFGGNSYDSAGALGLVNDLWAY